MGYSTWCFLGFSTLHSDSFSRDLERTHGFRMARKHQQFFLDYSDALGELHEAVDAAVDGTSSATKHHIARGLDDLRAANDCVSAIGESLASARQLLTERAEQQPDDPLIAREPLFQQLDYSALYRELLVSGSALPNELFWKETVENVRTGGARAGLRMMEKSVRLLQSSLRAFIHEATSVQRLPLRELAVRLHGMTTETAAIQQYWFTLMLYSTYMTIICGRCTELYEAERYGHLDDIVAYGVSA